MGLESDVVSSVWSWNSIVNVDLEADLMPKYVMDVTSNLNIVSLSLDYIAKGLVSITNRTQQDEPNDLKEDSSGTIIYCFYQGI